MKYLLRFDILDEQLPADGTGFIVTENSNLHCDVLYMDKPEVETYI